MAPIPIYKALESLPTSGLTVTTLKTLDYVVPGQWNNITHFATLIKEVTGEEDESLIQEIGERAIELYNDAEQESYQTAMRVFHLVDDLDKIAGTAAMANKVGDRFSFLGFLERLTPKADNTQALDAGIKFTAELVCFCLINGIPGDSVSDFARSLKHYAGTDLMRIAAWVCIDCVLPLGPDFMRLVIDGIEGASQADLTQNPLFGKLASYMPGTSVAEKQQLILANLQANKDWALGFVADKGIDQRSLIDKLRPYIDVADDNLDYVAAALDIGTNYYEHTGTQTIARQLIDRAYGEI
ncbi:MAG: hypothetical protein AAFS10_21860 [Myxococcota bacterium]